jgi:hypothetical protein
VVPVETGQIFPLVGFVQPAFDVHSDEDAAGGECADEEP